jgi:tyrosyl-tRNA synthetase
MGHGKELFGLVTPLLLTATGAKFGKSEEGAVWLDPSLTTPYKFYQYWINTADQDVDRYLKMFTFVPLPEIDALLAQHDLDRGRRLAQRRLAAEVTTWVHGEEARRQAEEASAAMFRGDLEGLSEADLAAMPSTQLVRADLEAGLPIVDLLARVKLARSKGEARRLVEQGGIYVNSRRVEDVGRVVSTKDLSDQGLVVLRAGKKSYHLLRMR